MRKARPAATGVPYYLYPDELLDTSVDVCRRKLQINNTLSFTDIDKSIYWHSSKINFIPPIMDSAKHACQLKIVAETRTCIKCLDSNLKKNYRERTFNASQCD